MTQPAPVGPTVPVPSARGAPVAGSIFAAQIVLGNFSMNLFAPVIFSAVVATMVSRYFFGFEPFYKVPAFNFTSVVNWSRPEPPSRTTSSRPLSAPV